MTQTEMLFGSELGRKLRDEGMEQVQQNAGEWRDVMRQHLDTWINKTPSGAIFIGEDIRLELQNMGVEEPHHPNAWSAVIGGRIRQCLKSGRIQVHGLKTGSDPKAHARRMIAYRVL
jgi:hypothetical protein